MSDVETMYHQVIIDRARHPRHQRRLELFDAEVQEVNPFCGDRVILRLQCDASRRVAVIGYEARACAICVASADLMAEMALGMAADEADTLADELGAAIAANSSAVWRGRLATLALFAPLHDSTSRIGCATLPWRGLARALKLGAKADVQ
ncbi:SUF system NifU family Fe-S cluster assembly protein [Acidisoma cellulosilytica]|uniref:SUF system NifU family Fe-S cluster assembly protein n=1 Tax=Acidisoma cellulosilyticum TaxID=2802395 RepID=A0A963Z5W6_9PROT|nr:SUF system NifU family Fe-S cluster assembly protein [Acidisoma cellulosilyticum]MCB8883134.1 SUF system NifU family Fe-S cluster assembly protein [Acidisoma cellulosilyticum]